MRNSKFHSVWSKCIENAKILKINDPDIPRTRKVPKRFNSSNTHEFETLEDYHRNQYYEIIDKTLMSLSERFNTDTMKILNKFENFVIGKTVVDVNEITSFYNISIKGKTSVNEINGGKLGILLFNSRDT